MESPPSFRSQIHQINHSPLNALFIAFCHQKKKGPESRPSLHIRPYLGPRILAVSITHVTFLGEPYTQE
ncbi:unnamed protein product [Lactuca virosa]|uniref:Uncharacterized protein n=1 Tax=Lactuca virosa TaxID=75947 RepID=A0AAU9PFT5_9ASTR|nr:unnamed protein product [Lactuca virosa]